MRLASAAALAAALTALSGAARAQSDAALRGTVVDRVARTPVAGAAVNVGGSATTTNGLGTFALAGLRPGDLAVEIRAVGFLPLTARLTLEAGPMVSREFELTRIATPLDTLTVKEAGRDVRLSEFEERKKSGFGRFLDEAVLRKYESHSLGELVKTLPGLMVHRGASGQAYVSTVRAQSRAFLPCNPTSNPCDGQPPFAPTGLCYADVYVDGVVVWQAGLGAGRGLFDINQYRPEDVAGVEYYPGGATIPSKYNRTGAGCGVLLIWTRITRRDPAP